MKRAAKIAGWVLALLFLLLLAGLVALQAPQVQTALVQKLVSRVKEKVDADIQFSKISVRPFDALVAQDLLLLDRAPVVEGMDTILYVRNLSAKFSLASLLDGGCLHIRKLKVQDGCFNLAIEPDSLSASGVNTNIVRIFRKHPTGSKDPITFGNLVQARSVEISNFRYGMNNPVAAARMEARGSAYGPGVINWNNMHATLVYAHAQGVKVADDYITLSVPSLEILETDQGFHPENVSAEELKVGKGLVRIDGLELHEKDTRLLIKRLILDGWLDDYEYFEEKIRMDITLQPGTLFNMQSIKYFASALDKIRFRAAVQGRVEGYVCDLHLKDVRAEDLDNGVTARVSGSLIGLPEEESTLMDFTIPEFSFTSKGLGGFVEGWSPSTHLDLSAYAPGERFCFNGRVSGPFNRMLVKGDINSGLGSLLAGLTLRNTIDDNRPIIIDGQVQTRDLHLGKLLSIDALGPVSLVTGLSATFRDEGPNVRIDSLKISRLNALDYDYTDIAAVGTYRGDAFDGRITASDPNLSFLFQGTFNLSKRTRNAAYQFYASLGYADLHALHIDKRERSKISFQAASNFIRTDQRDWLGDISLTNLMLESETGRHNLGDVSVRAHANDNMNRIRLDSPFMEGSFVGTRSIPTFLSDLQALLMEKELPALLSEPVEPWSGSTYDVWFKVHDAQELLNFLKPGLYIENKSEAFVKIDREGVVTASVKSGRMALGSRYVKDLKLNFDNSDDVLSASLSGSQLSLGGIQLQDNRLSFFADDNHLGIGYSFDNGEETDTHAEIYFSGDLDRKDNGLEVIARALPSNIYYNGNGWGLSSGDIRYLNGNVHVDQLLARHEDETLQVNGGFSMNSRDTLSVRMEKFNVAFLNTLTGGNPPLEGMATGLATVISPASPTPGLLANIICDSTRVSGHRMGSLAIGSSWNDANKRFDIVVNNLMDGQRNIMMNGYYVPSTSALHASARLNKLDMGYAAPFMDGLFSEFEGQLSGKLDVDGKANDISKLHIDSEGLSVANGRLTLDYTRVPYLVNGGLRLNDKGLYFDRLNITDQEDGHAKITGGILFGGFKNFTLDTHLQLEQIHVLALPKGVNPLLFGNAYASGRVDVTGPLNKIFLDIDGVSSREGDIHIMLDSSADDQSRELLTFTEPPDNIEMDPYELMMATNAETQTSASDLRVKLRIQVTPELQAYLDIGDENSLNGAGSGVIELESRPSQDLFTLGGDYTLSGGSFHFSALSLMSWDFTIQDGSALRFNGDVWDTDLDVKGLYVTKASLNSLISDETAINRRTVNCGIDITGKLRNPEMDFSIDIPDLNPVVQAQVDAALNTEDKVQKQFLYLLVAGSFLPSDDSGVTTSGSDMLLSNVSSIMTGQLNNIFQKLDIPLDLGLNYKSTSTGSNIFDVALSTQLFNNRVLVNGTVGNKQLVGGTTTNEVAGDIDIEIKLNRSGSLRLNLFSHSADQFTYYLDNSQRNGGGIAYQREFNSFRGFFKDLFSSRKEREERALRSALSPVPNIQLQIDSTGKSTPYEQQ